MKFQTKMRTVYAILGILTAIVAGYIYYSISMEKIKEREMQNLSISVRQLSQQYDELIQSMKDVSYYLLSDADTLTAITTISTMERSERTERYFLNSEDTILSQENNDYISKKFYRVVFCNDNCEPIANHNMDDRKIRRHLDYKKIPWYERAKDNQDTFTILGMHPDTWGDKDNLKVLSVVKAIQGRNMGYIEVQMSLEDVRNKLQLGDTDLNVCLLDDKGEVIYQNGDVDLDFCRSLLQRDNIPADTFKGSQGARYLAVGEYNVDAGTTVMVYKNSSVIQEDSSYVVYMSFFLIGGMLLFSLLYVTVSTRHLTKPMIRLQEAFQNTSLETLTQSMNLDLKDGNDEFRKMGQVYEDMRSRLHTAIQREKQLSTLQLQTQFDVLQAQVNPHFIYNVLNVISGRGSLNDDEVICDICDELAGMLRYSTDTKEKYATLKAEITYLELYFSLLKYRYKHKLEYTLELDKTVANQILPKLVIQQLVENSINHGFQNISGIMRISVSSYKDESRWYIRVSDNGEGFSPGVKRDLDDKMNQLKEDLADNFQNVEMRIGGMGLLNTFARLYLLNGDDLVFRIQNKEEGGAEIIIGAALK